MSEEANKILLTTNYDMFKLSARNRPINREHLRQLKAAISKCNQLDVNPILINSEFEVINGQHRLTAAKELGLPIYYMQKPTEDIPEDFMLTANMYQRSTRPKDAMDYYSSYKSIHDYKVLKDCCSLAVSPPGAMASLIGSIDNYRKNGTVMNTGEFKLKFNDIECYDIVNKYMQLREILRNCPIVIKKLWQGSAFCVAFKHFYSMEGIDWVKFYHRSRMHWKMFDIKLYTYTEWTQRFIDIYNKGAKTIVFNPNKEGDNDE